MTEDGVTDFLTKFGLITHLIEDITQFRMRIKTNRGRVSQSPDDYNGPGQQSWWRRKKDKYNKLKNKKSKYTLKESKDDRR